MNQTNIVDDAFAIWYEEQDKNFPSSIDIHLNEWFVKNGRFTKSEQTYLDVGIRIYNAKNVNRLSMYFPFKLKKDEIIDLYEQVSNKIIADEIFNTICSVECSTISKFSTIRYNGRIENVINIDGIISVETINENSLQGSVLCFDIKCIKEELTEPEVYLRFRIPHKSVNDLFKKMKFNLKYAMSCLLTPESEFDYIYINRINDTRLSPVYIKRKINCNNHRINKIITSVSVPNDYSIDYSKCYKIRKLEKHLLDLYTPLSFNYDNVLSYQWLTEKNLNSKNTAKKISDHYYFFIKMSQKTYRLPRVIVYSFIVVIMSGIGSALWPLISRFLGWN